MCVTVCTTQYNSRTGGRLCPARDGGERKQPFCLSSPLDAVAQGSWFVSDSWPQRTPAEKCQDRSTAEQRKGQEGFHLQETTKQEDSDIRTSTVSHLVHV